MRIAARIGFDIVSCNDDANVCKFFPEGLQYKRIGRFRQSHETVQSFNSFPPADSVAAVHAVMFGHNGPDTILTKCVYGFNQIGTARYGQRMRKHPFMQNKCLGDFGTIQDLRTQPFFAKTTAAPI